MSTHVSGYGLIISHPELGDVKLYDVQEMSINRENGTKVVETMNPDAIAQGFQDGILKITVSVKTFVRKPKPELDWLDMFRRKLTFDARYNEGTPQSPGRKMRLITGRVVSANSSASVGDGMQDISLVFLDEKEA